MQGGGGGAAMPLMVGVLGASAGAVAGGGPVGTLMGFQAGTALGGGIAGMAAGQAGEQQAKDAAVAEQAQGEQRAAAIRRSLLDTLGTQRATLASRGIDVGSGGTPGSLSTLTQRAADQDLRANRANTLMRLGGLAFQGQQDTLQGQAALVGGIGQAAEVGTSYLAYRQQRGPAMTASGPAKSAFSWLGSG